MKQVRKTHRQPKMQNEIITPQRDRARQMNAQKKKRHRKRKYMIYYIFFIILILSVIIALSMTVFFRIDNIDVQNAGSYTPEQIIAVSGVKDGENLIRCDVGQAEDNILEAYPDFDKVEVKRVFPSGLQITCTQAVCVYCYQYNESYIYTSQSGRILSVNQPTPAPNAIVMQGITIQEPIVGDYIELTDQSQKDKLTLVTADVEQVGLTDITGIALTQEGVDLRYQNRITIEIDDMSQTEYILNASKVILDSYIGSEEKGKLFYVDSNQSIHFLPE